MQIITQLGAFTAATASQINSALANLIGTTTGTVYYLNPANGSDGNDGLSPGGAVQSLAAGYALLSNGNNDVLVLIGNGSTTGTARLSSAFTWAKNAAHLIGMSPPSMGTPWPRIAPTSGIAAFTNLLTISGNGCYFCNMEWWHGFTTGVAAMICASVSGTRNVFAGIRFGGMGDAASAQSTTSRSLVISNDENVFISCNIGGDTVLRTVANASLEFTGTPARCRFEDCVFPIWASSADALCVLGTWIDRYHLFNRCRFLAATKATGYVQATGVCQILGGSGYIIFQDCTLAGPAAMAYDGTTKSYLYLSGCLTVNNTGIALAAV